MSIVLERQLPKGWTFAFLSDIAKNEKHAIKRGPFGSHLRKEFFVKSGYKIYEQQHVINNDFTIGNYYINEKKFQELRKFEVKSGDIVISCSGTIGKIAIVPNDIQKGIINQALLKITLNSDIIHVGFFTKLFQYWMLQANVKHHGSSMGNLSSVEALKQIPILLPPLNEQTRIVAKIEELFSKIDKNIEILKIIQRDNIRYKKSLLKQAFIGSLTQDWKVSKISCTKSANDIINYLRNEKERIKEKFIKLPESELEHLPKLPLHWSWTYLSNLGELRRGKSKHRPRNDPILFGGKYPFIQTGIVRNSRGKITNFEQTYNERGLAQSKLFPENTVCITIAANIAETGILTFPACFPDSIVGLIGFQNLVNPLFVMYYIKSNQDKLEAIAPATAQKNINVDILQKVVIPIMSYEEQCEVVSRIELGFSMSENLEKLIGEQNRSLIMIKNSILKQAFVGQLVSQDPNDAHADILLEKIKQEKQQIISTKSGKKKNGT